jgi:hypothetical protein
VRINFWRKVVHETLCHETYRDVNIPERLKIKKPRKPMNQFSKGVICLHIASVSVVAAGYGGYYFSRHLPGAEVSGVSVGFVCGLLMIASTWIAVGIREIIQHSEKEKS